MVGTWTCPLCEEAVSGVTPLDHALQSHPLLAEHWEGLEDARRLSPRTTRLTRQFLDACFEQADNPYTAEEEAAEKLQMPRPTVKRYRERWQQGRSRSTGSEAKRRRNILGQKWRRRLRPNDRAGCLACREVYDGKEFHLAHVSPVKDFQAIDQSFRLDNLVILCKHCHRAHDDGRAWKKDPHVQPLVEERRSLKETDEVQRYKEIWGDTDISREEAEEKAEAYLEDSPKAKRWKELLYEILEKSRQVGEERRSSIVEGFQRMKEQRGWHDAVELGEDEPPVSA